MLAIQAADCMLYLPESEVASLTPVYPDRWRAVTFDCRVGHIPRLLDTRSWVALGTSWVSPRWLRREGDFWRDPAGFLYPYQELAEAEVLEESAHGIRWISHVKQKATWTTDEGEVACELKFLAALAAYSDLIRIDSRTAVHRLRIRRICHGSGKRRIVLDTGQELWVMPGYVGSFCQALGLESPSEIDLSVPSILYELRDYPYDLARASGERLRADFAGPRPLMLGLIWRAVLSGGAETTDQVSFYADPIQSTLARAGWEMTREALRATLDYLIVDNGLFSYRQLGYRDALLDRRALGPERPDVIVLGGESARDAAAQLGLSFFDPALWMGVRWEYFVEILRAAGVDSVRLLAWGISKVNADAVLRHLGRLDLEVRGGMEAVEQRLESLRAALALEPPAAPQVPPAAPQAPLRVAVQTRDGLRFFRLDEVAAVTPTPPGRLRLVDKSGAVGYRLDRPEGPLAPMGDSWVRSEFLSRDGVDPAGYRHSGVLPAPLPALPPADPVVLLERRKNRAVWVHLDGREVPTGCSLEKARLQHGALVRVTSDVYVNRQHLLAIGKQYRMELSGGLTRSPGNAHHARELARQLGLPNLWSLDAREELFHYNFWDYPYEILAAPTEVLRAKFGRAMELVSAVIWQNFCYRVAGLDPDYGDSFRGFFYSLQPALYRVGFLRAPQVEEVTKEPLYLDFGDLLWKCVYRYRLFTYEQFGFVDPRPHNRLLGTTRVGVVLVVEKGDLVEEYARRLHHELGVTVFISGGSPKLIDVEYFALALRRVYAGEVRVLAYVDHDWSGALIGPAFVRQLTFYGFVCAGLATVMTPGCFHPNELALLSHPVLPHSVGEETLVANWMAQGGGIDGQARGISANCLFPYERVRARVEELL
ncbi:MAG: hypothetical protein U0931_08220 [Vulcanimicrobiota bacterium]